MLSCDTMLSVINVVSIFIIDLAERGSETDSKLDSVEVIERA